VTKIFILLLLSVDCLAQTYGFDIKQLPIAYRGGFKEDTIFYGRSDTILVGLQQRGRYWPYQVNVLLMSNKADSLTVSYSKRQMKLTDAEYFLAYKSFTKSELLKFENFGQDANQAKIFPDTDENFLAVLRIVIKSRARKLAVYRFRFVGFYLTSEK
jgi:hypothetical protein